jgi:hypothetical protein
MEDEEFPMATSLHSVHPREKKNLDADSSARSIACVRACVRVCMRACRRHRLHAKGIKKKKIYPTFGSRAHKTTCGREGCLHAREANMLSRSTVSFDSLVRAIVSYRRIWSAGFEVEGFSGSFVGILRIRRCRRLRFYNISTPSTPSSPRFPGFEVSLLPIYFYEKDEFSRPRRPLT